MMNTSVGSVRQDAYRIPVAMSRVRGEPVESGGTPTLTLPATAKTPESAMTRAGTASAAHEHLVVMVRELLIKLWGESRYAGENPRWTRRADN